MKGLSKLSLSIEQKACNFDTMKHIERVRNLLHVAIKDLMDRAEKHDQSKLESPEVELFTELTPKLSKLTYGSEEYNQSLKELKPALDHHYARNSHHPEHFPKGINDMTLGDLQEMFADWKAASERHHDGNILKSIDINAKRFNMSDQLKEILINTAERYE